MTTLYAAILILSVSGSATRSLETTDSIAGIVGQVVIGGVKDVLGRRRDSSTGLDYGSVLRSMSLHIDGHPRTGIFAWTVLWIAGYIADRADKFDGRADSGIGEIQRVFGGLSNVIGRFTAVGNSETAKSDTAKNFGRVLREMEPTLRIDGQERTGILAWLVAVNRVASYALDREHGGCVAYGYRLSVRGYDVRRHTEICDGRVILTTSTGWVERIRITDRITREVPIHATITITARESTSSTRIVGSALATANLSEFRCGLVRRFADKRAAAELDSGLADALLRIERGGTTLYQHGASDVLSIVRDAIRIGSRR
jgi:hypothetical protein